MRTLTVLFMFLSAVISFAQADNERPFPLGESDPSGQPVKARPPSDDDLHTVKGLEHRVSELERLVAGFQASNGCANLKFFAEILYPVMVLDDHSGYPGPISSFSVTVREHVRCVELEILAAIETDLPLVDTTTAGVMILNEVNGNYQPVGSVKVLGRAGYECYENENTSSVTAPVIDGRVYYQLLNLYPPGSDQSTTTGVVISVVGYYGDWH